MTRRVFRGHVIDGQCTLRFRLDGTDKEGVAVIDTGFPAALIGRAFAQRSGLAFRDTGVAKVSGIGGPLRKIPTTLARLALLAADGGPFMLAGEIGVDELPDGTDLLLGTAILRHGTFMLNGPDGTWEWVVDTARIERWRLS